MLRIVPDFRRATEPCQANIGEGPPRDRLLLMLLLFWAVCEKSPPRKVKRGTRVTGAGSHFKLWLAVARKAQMPQTGRSFVLQP